MASKHAYVLICVFIVRIRRLVHARHFMTVTQTCAADHRNLQPPSRACSAHRERRPPSYWTDVPMRHMSCSQGPVPLAPVENTSHDGPEGDARKVEENRSPLDLLAVQHPAMTRERLARRAAGDAEVVHVRAAWQRYINRIRFDGWLTDVGTSSPLSISVWVLLSCPL